MIKQFFTKQAAKIATKNLPKDQQEMIMKMMEKDPALFEKIAKDIKKLTDEGIPEMYAAFEVMKKYEMELKGALAES